MNLTPTRTTILLSKKKLIAIINCNKRYENRYQTRRWQDRFNGNGMKYDDKTVVARFCLYWLYIELLSVFVVSVDHLWFSNIHPCSTKPINIVHDLSLTYDNSIINTSLELHHNLVVTSATINFIASEINHSVSTIFSDTFHDLSV